MAALWAVPALGSLSASPSLPFLSSQRPLSPDASRVRRSVQVRCSAEGTFGALQDVLKKGKEMKAFVEHCDCIVEGAKKGPLCGLTFAAKDMFHIASFPTGFGNPTWLKTHPIPTKTAAAIQMLLDAGATLTGKAQMDELAFSLSGRNAHYGTPLNPSAPERIPGGSSSGSASAVAAGLVDFAIGSDTAGSVRIPAAHCGIFGMRPSHGRISMEGALPLQPSVDTVGWFANDIWVVRDVGQVLLAESRESGRAERRITRWLVAQDAFESLSDPATVEAVYKAILPIRDRLQQRLKGPESIAVGTVEGGYEEWVRHMRVLQLREAWESNGKWIQQENPVFGDDVRQRFEAARVVEETAVAHAQTVRAKITKHMRELVSDGCVLFVPAAPGIAPSLTASSEEIETFRRRALCLTVIAGPAGLPQVNVPITVVEGAPVGLGLVGPWGWDEELLDLAFEITTLLENASFAESMSELEFEAEY